MQCALLLQTQTTKMSPQLKNTAGCFIDSGSTNYEEALKQKKITTINDLCILLKIQKSDLVCPGAERDENAKLI